MNEIISSLIQKTAGELRAKTFLAAAEFALEHHCYRIIETGCYRGNPSEGNSTLILGTLAREVRGTLHSFEISEASYIAAEAMLESQPVRLPVSLAFDDSVSAIGKYIFQVRFAYLDSLDCDSDGAAQRHQLAEVGAVLTKITPPCAILLDDHDADGGGKTLLSARYLRDRGWHVAAEGYQILFTKLA